MTDKYNRYTTTAQEYIRMALSVGGIKTPDPTTLLMAIDMLWQGIKASEKTLKKVKTKKTELKKKRTK